MVDARFALPPEDIDDLELSGSATAAKGKGRQAPPAQKAGKRKKSTQPAQDDSADLYDEILNGPIPSTSKAVNEVVNDEEVTENGVAEAGHAEASEPLNLIPKVLQLDNVEEFNKKVDRTGIIYLSRIPPGMGPSKVKHILSNYGELGRIYLVAAEGDNRKQGKQAEHKHRAHRFVEGWVEFMDKKVARSTADLLNARSIGDVAMSRGSKKNGGTKKWKDDVWTMKYLPRFKWNMLSEQVAVEAATRAALLRNELAQSKKEQAEYLRQVERAKNYDKAQQKKRGREERREGAQDEAEPKAAKKAKKERQFEQRNVVSSAGQGVDAKLGTVLDSLF